MTYFKRFLHVLGFEMVVKELVEHGAEVNIKNNDGATPLHFAANSGNFQ